MLQIFIFLYSILLCIEEFETCIRSSIYYRSAIRTRSHIFAPNEYQPTYPEHSNEASGPLDVRDFQYDIPSRKLVRVESKYIIFDSEEARWMSKVSYLLLLLF